MTIAKYLAEVKLRLLTDLLIQDVEIVRERATATDGYIRARLQLTSGDKLEFAEYVQLSLTNQIVVATYSYHWRSADGQLRKRWDNAPHFSHLPQAPHHIHDGSEINVIPGQPMSIFQVLDEIAGSV